MAHRGDAGPRGRAAARPGAERVGVSGVLAELLAALAPPGCLACRAAVAGAGERLCADCTRALPWLRRGCPRCGLPTHRGRGCPAAFAAFPRAWAPVAYEGVARDARRGAEVPRGAPGRGRHGGAHGREPAGRRCALRTRCSCPSRRARAPARARVRSRARARPPRSRAASIARSPTASRAAAAATRQVGAGAQRAPRAGPDRDPRARLTAAARDPRRRRPHDRRDARRLRPRARGRRRDRARGGQLRPDAVTRAATRRRGRPRPPTRGRRGRRRRARGRCRARGASGTRRARRP